MLDIEYDVIIIGWGKAGKTLATKLSANKQKVALIEKDIDMAGGACINVACLPTKALIHSAKIRQQAETHNLNMTWKEKETYYRTAQRYKRAFIKKMHNDSYDQIMSSENVDLYVGAASFLDPHTILIETQNKLIKIRGKKVVINTGSKPIRLDLDIKSKNIFYSDAILELNALPKRLLVVGAGFIGLEFASMYSNFGSKVTVYSKLHNFLPSEDYMDSYSVKETMQTQGINFENDAEIIAIKDYSRGTKVTAIIDGQEVEEMYDAVLVSIGREPNLDRLGLSKAGVITENGAIKVDENLKTTADNIWAVGDCKGGPFFTYVSLDDSRIVLPQLLDKTNERNSNNRPPIPFCLFIDPAYARVGMNCKEADAKGIKYEVKQLNTSSIPKAKTIHETFGWNKILVDSEGYIIGATLFNYQADEMINLISLAIAKKIKYDELANFIYTHPTFTESLNMFG
ncbi:dihydrolipoyl dehydrogenase family protein [Mycoplasma sp. B6188]|uniref:dihydrolipoyl dehydrogenase family protein n=1 Tax=unclassified Mycoplasma TaxID=2683645 RepID=UPI003AAF68B6